MSLGTYGNIATGTCIVLSPDYHACGERYSIDSLAHNEQKQSLILILN